MVATIIGGGMFALPVAFVHVWFLKGLLVLSATGILMLITGLILVDITMRFPPGARRKSHRDINEDQPGDQHQYTCCRKDQQAL